MINSDLIHLIKLQGDDIKNGSALIELMDWCGVTRLVDVTQEQAEIFYMLYRKEECDYLW